MSDSIYTMAEWRAEATRLFGPDLLDWRFVCPSCGHVASVRDWREAGAPVGTTAFSCVGRWLGETDDEKTFRRKGGPCNYAGGGLFGLNPVTVVLDDGSEIKVFAFAEQLPAAEMEGGPDA